MTNADALEFLVNKGPGRTELELAKAIYGDRGEQPMVHQEITLLEGQGKVVRRGAGGHSDPYRVYLP